MTNKLDLSEVENAYKFLKRNYYNENYNLFIRNAIAQFEANNFQKKLEKVQTIINTQDLKGFQQLLKQISFRVLPKNIETLASVNEDFLFISNLKQADEYAVK